MFLNLVILSKSFGSIKHLRVLGRNLKNLKDSDKLELIDFQILPILELSTIFQVWLVFSSFGLKSSQN